MDFVNKLTGGDKPADQKPAEHAPAPSEQGGVGGFLGKLTGGSGHSGEQKPSESGGGGFMDKLNSVAGGGAKGEENEDGLDKGVDWVQEHVLGQGDQSNETAAEQAKDEQISDFIRKQYKGTTGREFPVEDKDRKYGL